MKFTTPFLGCKAGEIYPTQFLEGAECPKELESAAIDVGAVVQEKQKSENKSTDAIKTGK
jgi:hypothetical protein